MKRLLTLAAALLCCMTATHAQVSNDNEDGVNKVDQRFAEEFVPGQVLVKFKDESSVKVRRNAKGQFQTSSVNTVDQLLLEFGVEDMEKLFPAEEAKPASKLRTKRAPNGTMVKERNLDKVFLVRIVSERADSTMMLIERLKERDDVEYAEPNYLVYITAEVDPSFNANEDFTDDATIRRTPVSTETTANVICPKPSQNPLYFRQYGITQQNIDNLWDKPIINKKRPVIAILDTGVDINHPDLKDNIWQNTAEAEGETAYDDDKNGIVDDKYGWNFVEGYYDLTDRNGHGTHVAGIAAAADNNVGIVGANPQALIMPVKVMNDRGQGDLATICRGMIYAAENGADVVNCSWGVKPKLDGTIPNALKDAVDKAYQTSILVASAGNDGSDIYNTDYGTRYPAAYYLVLGVEASASNLQRASFSNYDPDGPIYSEDGIDGRNYEVQMPGDKIYSTLPNGKYDKLSGTSMSSPLMAGAVSALLMVKDYPSKDVLFGDLIHLKADFEKIYSDDTPRTPKIDLISMNVDDNVNKNTNIDGQVDVGETIKFYPVLRNTWADATNIKLKLTVDDEYKDFVEILNPQVDFGYSISAYGRQKAQTPIMVMFGNNIDNNTRIKFHMDISYTEEVAQHRQDVYITVNNMVKIGGMITEDMTLTADHEWRVSSNLAIPKGVTLTIEPGTVIKVADGVSISANGNLKANGEIGNMIHFTTAGSGNWKGISTGYDGYSTGAVMDDNNNIISHYYYVPNDTLRYCMVDGFIVNSQLWPVFENCIVTCNMGNTFFSTPLVHAIKSNLVNCDDLPVFTPNVDYSNCVNSYIRNGVVWPIVRNMNFFNNKSRYGDYQLWSDSSIPVIHRNSTPSYLGTSRVDLADKHAYDIDYDHGFAQIDLSNLLKEPVREAHGIVWKVVVNGKDAQDEYEDLAPLGVGKHKFEVYFNRPMNKEKIPQITFGVREPYTQHAVNEDGSWNEEGTIYTAYKTIGGRTMSDGVNRIYVQGAEDNEYFECPYEKTRFNINIQEAGSLATGFAAEAGMGKVDLTWHNEDNDFEDAMGFNIYRYTIDETTDKADTICINKEIVGIETTEYTDYDVVPGTTYYYMYKVLSTGLKEYDMSNVVAVTPLTSAKGDANGSGEPDVADVITTVNYAAGMDPKPFIFEAADMNTDNQIDILDVIGIIQLILNPNAANAAVAMAEATAVYSVEDGVLYVESPVALAGVQAQLNMEEQKPITVSEDLNGFEQTSAWLTDNDYLFLAYNMTGKTLSAGKHALLYIGDAELTNLRLSDANGRNVAIEAGSGVTAIDAMGSKVMKQSGIFNLKGQKVAGKADDLRKLPRGIYIINGEKVVK